MALTETEVDGTTGQKAFARKILEARLWIARLGEGDVLRWWRTEGVLGSDGAFVGPRVLPKTHAAGRARIAIAVARHACRERYRDPRAVHLFSLDPWTEDELDAYLHERLADQAYWRQVMEALEATEGRVDPIAVIKQRGLVSDAAVRTVADLPLGPDKRSLRLPLRDSVDQVLELMVAGFTRGNFGELIVPYVPSEEWPRRD